MLRESQEGTGDRRVWWQCGDGRGGLGPGAGTMQGWEAGNLLTLEPPGQDVRAGPDGWLACPLRQDEGGGTKPPGRVLRPGVELRDRACHCGFTW